LQIGCESLLIDIDQPGIANDLTPGNEDVPGSAARRHQEQSLHWVMDRPDLQAGEIPNHDIRR
jgi:hypothetical protein